jgi:hypothetical protein
VPRELLVDVGKLLSAYVDLRPDPSVAAQRVVFGTSGHRGGSLACSFNEWHVLAISQAICEFRHNEGIDGPLFLGMDTHALSAPALLAVSISFSRVPTEERTLRTLSSELSMLVSATLRSLASLVRPANVRPAFSTPVIKSFSVLNTSTFVLAFTLNVSFVAGCPAIEICAPKSKAGSAPCDLRLMLPPSV